MNDSPVHALVSARVRKECLEPLQRIARETGRGLHLYTPEEIQPMAEGSVPPLTLGFLSDDVLGDSSKTDLTPEMALFCEQLSRAPALAWVQVPSAGVDRPQFRQWMEQGATICNAAGIASTAVAQSAIGGMLALARKMPEWMEAQRRSAWEPLRGAREPACLEGARVMIVGLGAIGQEMARLCRALRMHVIGVSQSGTNHGGLCDEVHRQDEMDAVLPRCDWLILCCPLTPSTQGLVDAERLARLPAGAGLIDVSRGGVVCGAALQAALESGRISGAYLDVFETEPLPVESAFWRYPNVLVSPHSAGDFKGRHEKLCGLFCRNVRAFLSGEPLLNAIRR